MMLSDVCLTYVACIRSAGGVCCRPAGWRVLADRARLGRPGSRLPLRASVAGLGGGISWRPPAYILLLLLLLLVLLLLFCVKCVLVILSFCLSSWSIITDTSYTFTYCLYANHFSFFRATLCVSAVFAVVRCVSVRPSVCHVGGLYPDGWRYRYTSFSA